MKAIIGKVDGRPVLWFLHEDAMRKLDFSFTAANGAVVHFFVLCGVACCPAKEVGVAAGYADDGRHIHRAMKTLTKGRHYAVLREKAMKEARTLLSLPSAARRVSVLFPAGVCAVLMRSRLPGAAAVWAGIETILAERHWSATAPTKGRMSAPSPSTLVERAEIVAQANERAAHALRSALTLATPHRSLAELGRQVRAALADDQPQTRAELIVALDLDESRYRHHLFAAVADMVAGGELIEEKDGRRAAQLSLSTF